MIPLRRTWAVHLTMPLPGWQALILILSLLPAGACPAGPPRRWARQLADECDALIGSAVKRPYGWGWSPQTAHPAAAGRKPPVEMGAGGSPAAGIVLLWAGLLLEEARYTEAAVHAARGVVASQAANGNIVAQPTFGATAGKRQASADVPEREATRAGAALLLAVIGADESKDELFRRSAVRAAGWLSRQQTGDGGWPSAAPPGAPARVPARLMRLDEPEVRDSIFALLLAASAAGDRVAQRAAQKSVEKLVALRISAPGRWSNLWTTLYRLDGSIEDGHDDFPPGADVLASRRATEALLAGGLLLDEPPAGIALRAAQEAARSLRTLQDAQGSWTRLYVLSGEQPAAAGESIFGGGSIAPTQQLWNSGEFGIPSVLAAADRMQQLGPAQMAVELSGSATIQERLATTICGLSDEPFALDWPSSAEEAVQFVERHQRQWQVLAGPPPDGLAERVRRLYVLLLRARLEAEFPELAD